MNDFLAGLVDRTLHPDESLHPRLPGWFEPSSPSGDFIASLTSEEPKMALSVEPGMGLPGKSTAAAPGTTPLTFPMQPAPDASQQVPSSLRTHAPAYHTSGNISSTTIQSQPAEPMAAFVPAISAPPMQPDSAASVASQVAALPDLLQPALQPPPAANASALPLQPLATSPPQVPEPAQSVSPAIPLPAHAVVVIPGFTPAVLSPERSAASQPAPMEDWLTPYPASLRPLAPSLTSSSPGEAAATAPAASTPPPPPTIEVTIGRIEVRAASPAPAARKSIPATPRLSLEDYLRQRDGGNR